LHEEEKKKVEIKRGMAGKSISYLNKETILECLGGEDRKGRFQNRSIKPSMRTREKRTQIDV
jgi:hypothetical protein